MRFFIIHILMVNRKMDIELARNLDVLKWVVIVDMEKIIFFLQIKVYLQQ